MRKAITEFGPRFLYPHFHEFGSDVVRNRSKYTQSGVAGTVQTWPWQPGQFKERVGILASRRLTLPAAERQALFDVFLRVPPKQKREPSQLFSNIIHAQTFDPL